MSKLIRKVTMVALAVGYCGCASVASATDQNLVQHFNQNSIYNCNANELSTYIEQSTKPLFMPLPVPNADQFTKEKEKEGGDPCLSLFNNLDALKDLQKVITVIQNFQMPSMPSMDGVTVAAKMLAMKMASMATQSVCNALTKKAAMSVINSAMHNKIGFSIDDVKSFDASDYAKGLAQSEAAAQLNKRGVDSKWVYGQDSEDYKSMLDNEAKERLNGFRDDTRQKGSDLTKDIANKMFD